MNRDTKIYISLALIVILIISGIYYWKGIPKELPAEITMKCIASQSVLYSSPTCSHCQKQKEILGEYFSLFKTINCFSEPEKCNEAGIQVYPTWVINEKQYAGVKSVKELAELTNCECDEGLNNLSDSEDCEIGETCIKSIENKCIS